MKSEDFKELQDFCEQKGYQLLNESLEDNTKFFVVSKKKDEWEGVEFVECCINQKIYRLDQLSEKILHLNPHKPSTEQAYVDQLKAKAFKLYGEIKEGDEFIEPTGRKNLFNDTGFGIVYNKHSDFLYNENLILYRQGKWATRVPEKVKVEWVTTSCDTIRFNYGNAKDVDLVKSGPELAKLIEEYLNK